MREKVNNKLFNKLLSLHINGFKHICSIKLINCLKVRYHLLIGLGHWQAVFEFLNYCSANECNQIGRFCLWEFFVVQLVRMGMLGLIKVLK